MKIVFPIHPHTRKTITTYGLHGYLTRSSNLHLVELVGYLDMLELERNAKVILTDSGGVIREAYFMGIPSVIVDDTIEWLDILEGGWTSLVEAKPEAIEQAVALATPPPHQSSLFGDGNASKYIVEHLEEWRKCC